MSEAKYEKSRELVVSPVHERTQDGRDRHFWTKAEDLWVCDCGEARDRFGVDVGAS